jgi:outer membrane protein assembly factor BamD
MASNDSLPRRPLLVGLSLLLALFGAAGCHHSRTKADLISNPDKLYDDAKRALDNGNYKDAINQYERLEARFPFSNASRQGHLDLMYAYYKNREPDSAVDQADQFIRENPTHPRVDYAYYVKGLVWFERTPNFLERWFRADLSRRPPIDARKSFQAFDTLVQKYPASQYSADARQRMVYLRNRLADYEIHVADYYLSRAAYVGAINRAKYAIENYDGAPAIRHGLEIMVASYNALEMKDLAANAERVLKDNYPTDQSVAEQKSSKKRWWHFW